MTQTKKSRIIRKNVQETEQGSLGMKNQTTTKEICRLQIQKQIELNDNYDMNSEEIFVNCLTEEEFDRKVKYILESKGFLDYQKRKIRRYFQHIKDTGWFHRFTYMDYKCAVEFDDLEIGRAHV